MCEASAYLRRPHNDVLGFHSPIGQVHGSVLIVAVDVGSDPVSQVSTEVSHGLSEIDGMLRVEVIHTKFGWFGLLYQYQYIHTPSFSQKRTFGSYLFTDNSHLRYTRSKSERARSNSPRSPRLAKWAKLDRHFEPHLITAGCVCTFAR